MIVLARTSPAEGKNRHVGLSQFLVDLSLPGIDVSGICDIAGEVHFNEVVFDGVELAPDALLGTERSEEHTSELQSLMRISYAVFCLKKKQIAREDIYTPVKLKQNTVL